MKKMIIVSLIVCVLLLTAGTYRLSLWVILNQYEEVCTSYQMNVTAKYSCSDPFYIPVHCSWKHDYIKTDTCTEYMLVRQLDIESHIYLFDWCEVYPDSNDCTEKAQETKD